MVDERLRVLRADENESESSVHVAPDPRGVDARERERRVNVETGTLADVQQRDRTDCDAAENVFHS